MKRILVFIALIVLMNSCGAPKTLYYWGGEARGVTVYENLAYMDYKSQTSKATCQLVCAYEDMITNPGGIRKVPPPGICAEYGYMLYVAGKQEDGLKFLKQEIQLYPESEKYISRIIKQLEQ